MPEELMEKLAARIEGLPPMPQSVLKLREAIAKPDANYDDLVGPLKEDPGVCADLLRVANSARYGVSHKVETIEEAVRYFGMPSLADFVSAACSERIIRKAFSNSIANLNDYVQHSRQISRAACFACQLLKMDHRQQEAYSISGLLHDIGRLVILLVTGERSFSKEAIGLSWDEISPEVESEIQIYGLNHADLGMRVCARWQFPPRIVNAVERHHTPLANGELSFDGFVIYLAEIMATDELGDGLLAKAVPPDLMRKLSLRPDDIIEARHAYQRERDGISAPGAQTPG